MQHKSPSLAGRAALAVMLTVGFYGLALFLAGLLLFAIYAEVRWVQRINVRFTFLCLAGAVTILWSIFPRPRTTSKRLARAWNRKSTRGSLRRSPALQAGPARPCRPMSISILTSTQASSSTAGPLASVGAG